MSSLSPIHYQTCQETTKLFEETKAIVYEETNLDSDESHVTISSILKLLNHMNCKLSNIEIKNSSLETKICSLDEIQGILKSMKMNLSKLVEKLKCTNTDFQTLESNMDSLGNLFDSVKEQTTSNQKVIKVNRKEIDQCKDCQRNYCKAL